MRTLFAFTLIFYCSLSLAQTSALKITNHNLAGTWQIDNPQVGDALKKNFRFYENGTFTLNFSEYDDLARIKSVKGRYRIGADNNSIYLTIESRQELVGGHLEPGSPGFQSSEFVLEGAKLVTIRKNDSVSDEFYSLAICSANKQKIMCIKIEGNKYYKISANPRYK
jgi:hypothetical protein